MGNKQRVDEWINFNESQLLYHKKQWDSPKESTKAFEIFIRNHLKTTNNVLDLGAGAGAGAATAFIAEKHQNIQFTAADYVNDYLKIGKALSQEKGISNLNFHEMDWFNIEPTDGYDAVISLQTLSWLPEPREPMIQIFENIKPKWIGLTSLFYEGDISCSIEVNEHSNNKKYFYNVYSLPNIERICSSYRYTIKKIEKFDIPFDIDRPNNKDAMGTYTKRVINDDTSTERLQISGPILMPWYMILIERN